ncbi:GNAT family N-acetyltransferase [Bacillus sp. 1P06AnD]|uniref:GNAT family N-acetyltransferase n=1 Tax=Bacillus sp. 1P06AnD TaxID=3132208 RepID=UPI0039A38405
MSDEHILFERDGLMVRHLEKEDIPYMAKWLSDPELLEFYEGRDNPFNEERILKVFYEEVKGRKDSCLILYDGLPVGYFQCYPINREERAAYGYSGSDGIIYGMDQFIGEGDYRDRGIGQMLVKAAIDFLKEKKGAVKVVLDPQIRNQRAVACYYKCGFRIVKELHGHEWHEGKYEDCYVMEV